MNPLTRKEFLKSLGVFATIPLLSNKLRWLERLVHAQNQAVDIYVVRNGPPALNVKWVIELAGGIQRFIDKDDVVVLKPNGQWPNQGYTHTQYIKALIDVILIRPGGFSGEIILTEHVHRSPTEAMEGDYCWNMSVGNRINNWPDMNYLELVADYQNRGFLNVTADPLYESGQGNWVIVGGPGSIGVGKQGWVHSSYTTSANGRTVELSYPILRSSYSNKLIDLKNGVWQNGDYTGQKVKLIFLPTLNNHGSFNSQDYAGPTSAIKTHIGIVDFGNLDLNNYNLHNVGYAGTISPQALGEAVGHLITQMIRPAFYMTCAEYTGYRSRTDPIAAHTKTVGLCTDPVTLDYWMCKHVMYPCAPSQVFMNPDKDNNLRKTLLGCHSKGVGTITEAEMNVRLSELILDKQHFFPVVFFSE
ncbi:MAG TPA: hypothetical protein VF831_03180 [Anaerolineales bacterium]